ncbi:MAG: hypothetical protein ACI9NQ_002167 [Paracoccaceae bacterium]|jgi:hypothetical protein
MKLLPLFLTTCSLIAMASASPITIPAKVTDLLDNYCYDCHDEDTQKGDLRLDQLGSQTLEARLNLLNKLQEQVFFQEMPPKKKKRQPTEDERAAILKWAGSELKKHKASQLEEKLKRSEYGNYINHQKLFSGEYAKLPAFTHDRRWLISEFIFNDKINKLVNHQGVRTIDGTRQTVIGDNGVNLGTRFGGSSLRQSITNPFLLPAKIGVRYYDNTALTGGHLLTMISNARKIAGHITSEAIMKAHYPAMHRIMEMELAQRETLRSRESFLEDHIPALLQDLFKNQHQDLLPTFTRAQIDKIEVLLDKKGQAAKLQDNLELIHGRYGAEDIKAIYRGLNEYSQDGVSYQEVVEKTEKDWFEHGINPKRIQSRVTLMMIISKHWDMDLIRKDVQKRNITRPDFRPLPEPEMATVKAALKKHRKKGDTYLQVIAKCMADWEQSFQAEREKSDSGNAEALGNLIEELYLKILERKPTATESVEELALTQDYIVTLDLQSGIAKLVETLILSSELVYRYEFGQGPADQHGRRMMSARDASYALAFALTDNSPDPELTAAAREGRLETREDYRREVKRMLARRDQFYIIQERVQKDGFNSSLTNTPIRKLRFFREFFGYPAAFNIFKDAPRFGNHANYLDARGRLIDEADMLVDHILQNDTMVFEELLSTEKFYTYHTGNNADMKASADRIKTIYDYFKKYDWDNFTEEELYEHWPFIDKMKMRGTVFRNFMKDEKRRKGWVRSFKSQMTSFAFRLGKGQTAAAPYNSFPMHYSHKGNASTRTGQQMRGVDVAKFFNLDHTHWDYPVTQPSKVAHRRGMLTHPAWLIAHSLNLETDPVRRGKWVREKLLAGTIPDVPITVDAVVPEDHHRTLRMRLEEKTGDNYCWKCHERMNPLGIAFEIYDDFGRFRLQERLEHPDNIMAPAPKERGLHIDGRPTYKTLPVNAKGHLRGTDDPALDGDITDALDLAQRLAKSSKVRQSIIRYTFRYFMGRNEKLSDSKTLIEAEHAYLKNKGSFDAVIISLLTSDSFIYRKPAPLESHDQ